MSVDLGNLVANRVEALAPLLIEWRRDLHAHPETSNQEHRTTDFLASTLTEAGISVRRLEATGLIAEIGAAQPTYRVGLRADLDALPIPERTGLDFASTRDGVCHACGHDVHTTVVLGAALALKEHEAALVDRGLAVRFIFQPAEEVIPGGAPEVIAQHALDAVDRVFAVHCDPSIDVGTIGLLDGPITAACDAITITLTGKGGHTSRPHLTGDLTYALAKVVTDVPGALSRRLDPRAGAALVWGSINAGQTVNVIPDVGTCIGTLRLLDVDAWSAVDGLVEELVTEIVKPYRVQADVKHVRGVPPVVNDPVCVEALAAAARRAVGPASVVPTKQSLGGEDFSWMLMDRPGAMARLGTRTPGGATYELHQGNLVVDERAISVGARVLAVAVLQEPDATRP
ncbi:amidohydrolase [Leekyejoonella antrihumi]|uniref:Amidohydrolase n=1 Tax=Leekyejoonella antrihumi TaxID=1660198 RepID=A0A563DU42_9MICO|nr:amidohydrolase [Leekyejoonella antrihumi]TWP33442.1 amidohydrolase [Leekyejoonella antrihumi]